MYDSVATLRSPGLSTFDQYGNEIVSHSDRSVYVMPLGVYSSEFYNAAQTGFHPSITFEIANKADYNGERLVVWNGTEYNVVRVDWTGQRDKIRLICEERINNA